MTLFNHLRMNSKIVALVLLTNLATLTLSAGAFVVLEYRQAETDLANELRAVAQTIANSSTAALSFRDHRTAQENLDSLRGDARVVGAAVYDREGSIAATFRHGVEVDRPRELQTGDTYGEDTLFVVEEIVLDGEVLGHIVVQANMDQLRERLWRYAVIAGLVLVVSLGVGAVLSRKLAAILIRPITLLTEAARQVTEQASYEVCLPKAGNDEVGELTECFNGMLVTIRDRDRQLNDHREHLEDKVRQRTGDLEIARAKAEESARLKSEFLANMSHEIRTPLNGMMGMTALALETSLPPETRDYLETANTSAESLLALINDILDFSKIDAGKLVMEWIPCPLPELMERLVKTFALAARTKGLELRCNLDPGLPPAVIVDPTRLQQVLSNLINNALKFTASGSVSLTVEQRGIDAGQARIRFSVTDTGIGIREEHQARIFDSFTQADGSTTRKFGGTGLGLSIASNLVALMGGSLQLESEPGSGSTFHFELPLRLAEAPPLSPLSALGAAIGVEQTRRLRVLVAEDNLVKQRLASRLLEKMGHEPVIAENGQQALDALWHPACPGFDLILMDSQMPEVDGFEAACRIRAKERETGGHLPIIGLTAHALKGDRERCLEAGMDDYLPKPVDPRLLAEKLAAVALRTKHLTPA